METRISVGHKQLVYLKGFMSYYVGFAVVAVVVVVAMVAMVGVIALHYNCLHDKSQ